MAFDYSEVYQEVNEAIAEYGATFHIVREAEEAVDPVTSMPSAGMRSVTPVLAVMVEYDEKAIDGSVIRRGDRQILMQAQLTLVDTDVIRLPDQSEWPIVNVQQVNPTGSFNLVYILQVRR